MDNHARKSPEFFILALRSGNFPDTLKNVGTLSGGKRKILHHGSIQLRSSSRFDISSRCRPRFSMTTDGIFRRSFRTLNSCHIEKCCSGQPPLSDKTNQNDIAILNLEKTPMRLNRPIKTPLRVRKQRLA
jgi:hypothetical protein